MCDKSDEIVRGFWLNLVEATVFKTPDYSKGREFSIGHITEDEIHVSLKNKPIAILIKRAAFGDVVHYLGMKSYDRSHPCKIGSNNNPALAGPLCHAARVVNGNTRCINYILPILASFGVVGIDGSRRPNTTWLTVSEAPPQS